MQSHNYYTDNELILRLQQGDEASFTIIFNRYWDKLYFVAHKHLKSSQAAEEIVQEVFLLLWQKKGTLKIHSLSLYLGAMTRYAVYHSLARKKKRNEIDLESLKSEPVSLGDVKNLDDKMLLDIIQKLSNILPEKCRMVFVQNKLLDVPLDQVAESLNISTKTAEAHLTKALKSMKVNLGDALTILLI